jgi:hypothetical protein
MWLVGRGKGTALDLDLAADFHHARARNKHYIAGPSGLVGSYTRRTAGSPLEDTFYFTHDHLGSIDTVSTASGAVQVRLSYDAFGARRKEAGWNGAVPSADWTAIANSTRRGYTGCRTGTRCRTLDM